MSRKAGKEKQVSGFCKQKCVGCYWENVITAKDRPCLECSRFCGPFSMDESYDFWMTVRATELQAKLMVMASNALHREYDEALDVCPTLMSAARELMRVPVPQGLGDPCRRCRFLKEKKERGVRIYVCRNSGKWFDPFGYNPWACKDFTPDECGKRNTIPEGLL